MENPTAEPVSDLLSTTEDTYWQINFFKLKLNFKRHLILTVGLVFLLVFMLINLVGDLGR